MRATALAALIVGATGSIGLLLHARQHPPPLLAVLFIIWVLAPFGVLGAAQLVSKRWSPGTQATLHVVTLALAVVSLLIYGDDAINHRTAHPAGVWVVVPPASVLVSVVAISIAALVAKRNARD